ncbi:type II secretion system F family protein [Candidatus Falkowbacteria bacterium]|nr:MAG: type II secretion system F family protein [Candidatus Falkowbacteria bacterium]
MPSFNFHILDKSTNQEQTGVVEADSEIQASETLTSRGYLIISLQEITHRQLGSFSLLNFLNHVSVKDVVVFSRQFSVMISASVPVVEALKVIATQSEKGKLKQIIAEISDEVNNGETLSGAFAKRPKLFSNFYISVVKSGEQSGKLDEALNYIADEMEKDYDMSSKIKGAMIYPTFVVVMMVAIGFLMMIFVVPKLTSIITEAGGELPTPTKILIAISSFLTAYWWVVIGGVIALIAGFRMYLKSKSGRRQFDYIILHMPIFGPLLRMIYLVRFTRSMNTLIIGGVNISSSLKVAGEVVNNTYYQDLITQTIVEVQGGNSICTVFVKSKEIPAMVSQMMMVGEKTGKLDVVLERITTFYNREITTLLAGLMSLIEPALMVAMGLGVGVMVAAILLPMYNVVSQI